MILQRSLFKPAVLLLLLFSAACSTARRSLDLEGFLPSSVNADSLISELPNYNDELNSIRGKGRALISEPGNSERVTINFKANRERSLLTIQNRIGIEGGQIQVYQDSILIYNKIDETAHKVSVLDGRITSLNELASVNIIDLLNFTVSAKNIWQVLENEKLYRLILNDHSKIHLSKQEPRILEIIRPANANSPYSEIYYEAYGELNGFILPRRITIISADKKSKVAFLVQNLEVNPEHLNPVLEIPDHITIERL